MSYYYIFMAMELVVRKEDLSLDLLDSDSEIYNYVLEQLDALFPSDRYDKTEHHDCFVYSLKSSIPATAILSLRRRVYELMNITLPKYESWSNKKVEKQLEGADLGKLISISQSLYNSDELFEFFRWRECNQLIDVKWSPDSCYRGLPIKSYGVQLYQSKDLFVTEYGGTFHLLTTPLLNALGDMPFANIVSAEIQDIDEYGRVIF